MEIITIYDNSAENGFKYGWGFSCLVKLNNKQVLFDVGEESKKLFYNMEKLAINLKDVEMLVVSHDHWDHTGGLSAVQESNRNMKFYFPNAFNKPSKLEEEVYTTGALGTTIPEQSLVIKTAKGLVVITGCAHPGIAKIVKTVKDALNEKIYLVMGGFHLPDLSDNEIENIINYFKELGVKKVAPSHCTGERAIAMFKEAYNKDFIENRAGNIIRI